MTDPGFIRDPEKIREALVIASSRLTHATQNRDQALAAAEKADADVLMYERHVEMCRRSLDGLLDEMVYVRKHKAAKVSR